MINRYEPSIVAATGGVLQEKVFLEVSQNLQESTCARDCEFFKIFYKHLFYRNVWATASTSNVVVKKSH